MEHYQAGSHIPKEVTRKESSVAQSKETSYWSPSLGCLKGVRYNRIRN